MRILYCTVGMPASGKSSLLDQLNVNQYTVSSDAIRQLVTGYDYNYVPDEDSPWGTTGMVEQTLSGKNDHQVWDLLYEIVEQRMKQGETVFIDSTMLFKHAFSKINKLRQKYHYRVHLIDLRHQSTGATFDEIASRNSRVLRSVNGKEVPKKVLHDYWKREEKVTLPKTLNPLAKTDEYGIDYQVQKSLEWRTVQPHKDSRTIVFGDIHGCYTALTEALEHVGWPERNTDDTYVFVGDYFDRGTENSEVFEFLYQRLDLPNLVLLRGNHERHLEHFVQGSKITNRGFQAKTLPELERAGFDKPEINRLVRSLQDMYIFKYPGQYPVVVTHAGLPVNLLEVGNNSYGLLPESVMVDGIGGFDTDVDAINNSSVLPIKQVHGHRNEFYHDANADDNSINLEQRVERGGHLAVAVFSKDGTTTHLYRNPVYDPAVLEDTDIDLEKMEDKQIKDALGRSHNIQVHEVTKGLYANNFTREAFQERKWTKLSVTARGLFNDEDGKVVMRGFSKFFEIDERKETTLDNLFSNHEGTVTLTSKQNGFLLLLGLYQGKLTVMTKGGTGDMAKMGKELVNELSYPEKVQEWLSKHPNKTVLCECVYPYKDSHMVKYDYPKLVVLNVVSDEYQEKYFPELVEEFTDSVPGFTPVETISCGNREEDIAKLKAEISDDNTFLNYINEEGYVGAFADGYHFKMKTGWYKTMKEVKHYLDRCKSDPQGETMGAIYLYEGSKKPNFKQKYTRKLLTAYDHLHNVYTAPTNPVYGDIDLPRAFPEAYNYHWWKKVILEEEK